jgi:phosphatidylinositol alpha-1,6-mannosyltransferase
MPAIIGVVEVPTTLLVTNDFPPRVGGIQRTLEALVRELPPDRVGVFCPAAPDTASPDASAYDADAPFRVFRQPEAFLWPTPDVASRVGRAARRLGADVVLFGATYPLALLGPRLARRGLPYLAAAHGFEYWLSIAPGTHALMRRATSRAARVAVMCSAFIARTVRTAVPDGVPVSVLYPGADVERFRPGLETADIRRSLGIDDRPLVVCVSRLVPRKGQDVLIRSLPAIRRRVPDATLLIVGGGPYETRLKTLAVSAPRGSVLFAGQVGEQDLPRYYAVGDVFAMPCRTRAAGLEVEGWGNVFVEAAACGRPVVVGDSGGARETLVDGETGLLVDGRSVDDVAAAVGTLLAEPGLAAKMGEAGRERVARSYAWPAITERLVDWLRLATG